MGPMRRTQSRDRTTASVLADIAHELSSLSCWDTRVQNALSLVHEVIQADEAAICLMLNRLCVYSTSDQDDLDETVDILVEHYQLLTGENINQTIDLRTSIQSHLGSRSYLSLPIIGAGHVLGVLHVETSGINAYSVDDISILSIVAMQIGAFVNAVQAHEEQARAREQLERLSREAQQREAELATLFASVADGISIVSLQGDSVMVNEVGKRILRIPPDEPLARLAEYQHWNLAGNPLAIDELPWARAANGETVRDFRMRMSTPWGDEVLVSTSASPIRDAQGHVTGAASVFRDVSDQIEIERRNQELFNREHHIAKMLQQALIPPQEEYAFDGVKISVKYQAASKEAEVGGDFYDVFDVGDGKIGILIGDVAGKGLPAAVKVAAVRYSVRSYAYLDASPGVVLTLTNESLCRDEDDAASFLTATFAVLDLRQHTLTYASAGHEPPSLRNPDGSIMELTQGGRALGISSGYTYAEASVQLHQGDTLLTFTDGITEARSHGRLFGIDGIKAYLQAAGSMSPAETTAGLLKSATDHAEGALQDDAAIIAMQIT